MYSEHALKSDRTRAGTADPRACSHNGLVVTPFSEIVSLCRRLEANRGRLEKRRLVAEFLRGVACDEVEHAVAFLTGRPFPASDPRVLSVRGLPAAPAPAPAAGEPLAIRDVAEAFAAVAEASGAGARRIRDERLTALAARARDDERAVLARIIGGEMRTGASDGIVLEAIAEAASVEVAAVRRAALFLGDLSVVAALARRGGAEALRPAPADAGGDRHRLRRGPDGSQRADGRRVQVRWRAGADP